MKAIYLSAYGNPPQNLRMVEVSEPNSRLLAGNVCVRLRIPSGSIGQLMKPHD